MPDDIIPVPGPTEMPNGVAFKLYKRRWFVVLSVFTGFFMIGLQKGIIPIVKFYLNHMGITIEQYTQLSQVGIFTFLATGIYFSRLLGSIGIRKMAYMSCMCFITGEVMQSLCYFNDTDIVSVRKEYRFYLLGLANFFMALAGTMLNNFPSKIAYSWFPPEESTRALVLSTLGYNVAGGVGSFLVPRIVKTSQELHYLSYMYLVVPIVYSVLVIASLTRSKPKIAPSASVVESARALHVPLKDGLMVLLGTFGFWLILLTFAFNISTMGVVQTVLQDILGRNGYSTTFCGTLVSSSCIFGVLFALVASTWLDKTANYVTYSRISSGLYCNIFCAFAYCINQPNMEYQIFILNLMAAFANSLTIPALTQVALRSSLGILPEPTVAAILMFCGQSLAAILYNLQHPLKSLGSHGNGYAIMLSLVALMVSLVDISYALFFKVPNRDALQAKLATRLGQTQLANQDEPDTSDDELTDHDSEQELQLEVERNAPDEQARQPPDLVAI